MNIIDNKKIYGSYRSKPIGEELFGPIDDKFRITDIRKLKKEAIADDKRKNISGTAATSYKKHLLMDIIKSLKINIKKYKMSDNLNVEKLSITQLIDIIEKYMSEYNLIIK